LTPGSVEEGPEMRPEKRQKRLERIIAAADELFARYGIRKTALEEVAERAGISKATLYHYVEGKDELVGKVLGRFFDEHSAALETRLAPLTSPVEKLRAFGSVLLEFHRRMMQNSAIPPEERMQQFPLVFHHLLRFGELQKRVLKGILEEGVGKGIFRTMDVERVSVMIWFVFKSMMVEDAMTRGMHATLVDAMLEVVFNGLLAKPEGGRK
jgi:AcrR family transcriptional regulator